MSWTSLKLSRTPKLSCTWFSLLNICSRESRATSITTLKNVTSRLQSASLTVSSAASYTNCLFVLWNLFCFTTTSTLSSSHRSFAVVCATAKPESLVLCEGCSGGVDQIHGNMQLHGCWLQKLVDLFDSGEDVTPHNAANQEAVGCNLFCQGLALHFGSRIR